MPWICGTPLFILTATLSSTFRFSLKVTSFAITILLKHLDYSILFQYLLKFRKRFKYGLRASAPFRMEQKKKQRLRHHSVWSNERNYVYGTIPYGAMKETTFTATFRMEQWKKQRLRHHSIWSNERNNVYGTIPYGAMKETTFTAPFRMEQWKKM